MTYEEEMIARVAIGHLFAIYNSAGDRGKVDDLVTAFAPDGVLDIESEAFAGREAIKNFIGKVASGELPAQLAGARHHPRRIDAAVVEHVAVGVVAGGEIVVAGV